MRWWLTSLVTAVVGAGLAIVVNVATDLKHDVWAWVAVAVLTVASATATAWAGKRSTAPEPGVAQPTHDETSGTVTVADSAGPPSQIAFGSGNSVIQQAGGSIHNGDHPRPNG